MCKLTDSLYEAGYLPLHYLMFFSVIWWAWRLTSITSFVLHYNKSGNRSKIIPQISYSEICFTVVTMSIQYSSLVRRLGKSRIVQITFLLFLLLGWYSSMISPKLESVFDGWWMPTLIIVQIDKYSSFRNTITMLKIAIFARHFSHLPELHQFYEEYNFTYLLIYFLTSAQQ